MSSQEIPPEFLEILKAVTGKRARLVVDHLLQHGFITTEDLENTYHYNHPPRAIRDVREQGIPIETLQIKNAQGRTIAAYRFGDWSKVRSGKIGGRRSFTRKFKLQLLEAEGEQCSICLLDYASRYLQIDHRIPYEVLGDADLEIRLEDHMLLCGSCNRAKSWSCEHCLNWLEHKNPDMCKTCYWANPASYFHIALRPIRRLDVVWAETEVEVYEQIKNLAQNEHETLSDYVKKIIRDYLAGDDT